MKPCQARFYFHWRLAGCFAPLANTVGRFRAGSSDSADVDQRWRQTAGVFPAGVMPLGLVAIFCECPKPFPHARLGFIAAPASRRGGPPALRRFSDWSLAGVTLRAWIPVEGDRQLRIW